METKAQKRQKRKRVEAEEAKKGKNLATMPPLVLHKVAERLDDYDRIAFASTCTAFRDAIVEVVNKEGKECKGKRKLVTNLGWRKLEEKAPCYSLDWFKWVYRSFDRQEGEARHRGGQDEPRQDLYDYDLIRVAAFQGSIETMKWLRSQGIPLDTFSFTADRSAAMGGQIEALKWLRSEGYEFDLGTSDSAAFGGQLETLKWCVLAFSLFFSFLFPFSDSPCSRVFSFCRLRNQDPPCPWSSEVCYCAIREGHLPVLQWLKREGCPWPDYAVPHAAYFGRIEILEWLRSEGEVFHESTCFGAAQGGKLETLKWLRNLDPPCPWDKGVCRSMAANSGHPLTARWIDEQPN